MKAACLGGRTLLLGNLVGCKCMYVVLSFNKQTNKHLMTGSITSVEVITRFIWIGSCVLVISLFVALCCLVVSCIPGEA